MFRSTKHAFLFVSLVASTFLWSHAKPEEGDRTKEELWSRLLSVWRSEAARGAAEKVALGGSVAHPDPADAGPRRGRFADAFATDRNSPSAPGERVIEQRGSSLVFVFDSTGSMKPELQQVKVGASKILEALTAHPDAPIRNFVMVPFNDPAVGPVTVTTDHDVFKESMENITAFGGGDCPEMSMAAVKKALQLSLPNSYIYVFTDAPAKDYRLENEVISLIQRKKSQVDFIMTDNCGSKTEEGYKVYEKIVETSSGQIYPLDKSQVKEVLKYVKVALQPNVVNLLSQHMPAPSGNVPDEHEVLIDKTLQQFTISVSGKNPSINLTDPEGKSVDGPPKLTPLLDLDNVKIVSVKEPDPGSWKVLINSESDYRLRTTGLSEINFRHGFSTTDPRDMRRTNYRPLKGATCYLLIETPDSEKVHNITAVHLVNMQGDIIQSHELAPVSDAEGLYKTAPFDPPTEFFYLGILGYGKDGLPIKRITTTAINSQSPEKPIVNIKSKAYVTLGSEGKISCVVESLVPISVQWYKNDEFTGVEVTCSQSCEAMFPIRDAGPESEGLYTCLAKNVAGSSSGSASLTVFAPPPKVKVVDRVESFVGETVYLKCFVYSALPYKVAWFKGTDAEYSAAEGQQLEDDTLVLNSVTYEDGGWYLCSAESRSGRTEAPLFLSVATKPVAFAVEPAVAKYVRGDTVTLRCSASGDSLPKLRWTRNERIIRQGSFSEMAIDEMDGSSTLTINSLTKEHEGLYVCRAADSFEQFAGSSRLIYTQKPSIMSAEKKVTVKAGEELRLYCEADGVPKPVIKWYRGGEDATADARFQSDDRGELRATAAQLSDSGQYVCEALNEVGSDVGGISVTVGIPPSLLQLPKDKKIEYGERGSLPCAATGVPRPEIVWKRAGERLPPDDERVSVSPDGALTINSMDTDDVGFYVCTAENALGSASAEVKIDIAGIEKPARSQSIEFSELKGIGGSDLTIPCGVSLGNPAGNVTWYKDGSEVTEGADKRIDRNGNLVVYNASGADSGSYLCSVTNLAGISSRSFDVFVSESPRISRDGLASDLKARRGAEIIIPCPAEGRPAPFIHWSKDGTVIVPSDNIFQDENGSLVIRSLNEENSGTYVCTGRNSVGSTSRTVSVRVQVPPTFAEEANAQSMNIVEGYAVLLDCKAKAVPRATVQWFKDDESLTEEHRESLRFAADVRDAGVYKCIATNEVGSASRTFNVTVLVPPVAIDGNDEASMNTKAGGRLVLECKIRGVPVPSILWQRNGMYLTRNTSEMTLTDSGLLILENVTRESAGAYVCDAENPAGITQRTYYVQVRYAPRIREEENWNGSISLKEGEELSVPCVVEGNPKPIVVWRKNGFRLRNELADNVILLGDNTLVLLQARKETSGVYRCEASNEEGVTFREYNVSVASPPSLISHQNRAKKKVNEGEPMVLTCPISNPNPPPTIQWLKDGKPLNRLLRERSDEAKIKLSDDLRELSIAETHPADRGSYSCTATNSAGRADAEFIVDVLMTPHFEEFNHVAHRTILVGGEVALNCSVSGNPQPKVTWRKGALPVTSENNPGVHLSTDGQNLFIPSGKLHHSGTYICTAVNEVNRKEREFYVFVLEPPTIIGKEEETIEVVAGQNASLNCPHAGVPAPAVKWWHLVGRDKRGLNSSAENVRLVNADCEDGGIYLCEVTNTAGTKVKKFNVTVLEPPDIEHRDTVENLAVRVGGNVSMVCRTKGHPKPDITWLHGGRIIRKIRATRSVDRVAGETTFTEDGLASLTISNATRDSAGTYTVLASNKAGVVEKSFRVAVLRSPMLERDSANGSTEHAVTVAEAFPVVLRCPLVGEPEPQIRWFREGEPIEETADVRLSGNAMHIVNSNPDYSGRYSCLAENAAGTATVNFTVTVIGHPRLLKGSGQVHAVVVGHEISLDCVAASEHASTLTWTRNSAKITNSTKVTVAEDGTKLTIRNASFADSGNYVCIASNLAGFDELAHRVQVVEAPALKEKNLTNHRKAFQLFHPISLKCPLAGYPEPKITWFKDGFELSSEPESDRIETMGPLLIVSSANTDDSGEYKCLAKNIAGVEAYSFEVSVYVIADWSPWSKWSGCSAECGVGEQIRHRACGENAEPTDARLSIDKSNCIGESSEKRKCLTECRVNGGWGDWSDWTPFSATCGRASRKRYRSCNNPKPANNGKYCDGAVQMEEFTELEDCPSYGRWSEWSEWSECSQSCDGGIKRRQRKCISQYPERRDGSCRGPSTDFASCNTENCGEDWLEWSEWSPCSTTCGSGQRTRFRKCSPNAPTAGTSCKGENFQLERCGSGRCGGVTVPSAANFLVTGQINGRTVNRSFEAVIESKADGRSISANMNDLLADDETWFPYSQFLLSPLSWSAAYEEDEAENGYSLTNGRYFSQSDIKFATGQGLVVKHEAEGTDSNGTLRVQIEVSGEVPLVEPLASVVISNIDQDVVQTGANVLYSEMQNDIYIDGRKVPFEWNSSISYDNPQKTMPYLVERLSTKDIRNTYDPETRNVTYTSSSTIGKKYVEDKCPTGFVYKSELLHCQDVNECEDGNFPCRNDERCENSFGSFACVCNEGFVYSGEEEKCLDQDECSLYPNLCSHFCLNIPGSFSCYCPYGYYLSEDLRTCNEVSFSGGRTGARRETGSNSTRETVYAEFKYETSRENPKPGREPCPPGFFLLDGRCRVLLASLKTATDVIMLIRKDRNECTEEAELCDREEICLNVLGSYQCLSIPCPEGFRRDHSDRNCVKKCETSAGCKSGSLVSEAVTFHAVTLTSAAPLKSVLQLDVQGRHELPLGTTTFRVTESGDLFRVRESRGRASVYPSRRLNSDTLYRLKVEARSYDANFSHLYNTEFVIFIIII